MERWECTQSFCSIPVQLFTENCSKCNGVKVGKLDICMQNPERLKEETGDQISENERKQIKPSLKEKVVFHHAYPLMFRTVASF